MELNRTENTGVWLLFGALFGAIGVAAGAFGAHALKSILTADRLAVYETAVRYQMIHAVALVATGLQARLEPSVWIHRAGALFTAGVLIFSGSLYVLVLADLPWMGAVTPLGGAAMIAGWAALAMSAVSRRRPPRRGV